MSDETKFVPSPADFAEAEQWDADIRRRFDVTVELYQTMSKREGYFIPAAVFGVAFEKDGSLGKMLAVVGVDVTSHAADIAAYAIKQIATGQWKQQDELPEAA